MKKRLLEIAAVVVLAIGLGLLWMWLLQSKETQSETEKQSVSEILLEENAEKLLEVSVKDGSDGFYAKKNAQKQMIIPSLEGLPTDSEKIDKLCKYACLLRGQKRVTNAAEKLEEYGLEEADAVNVEIVFEGGKTEKLRIGAVAQGVSNDSRYVLYKDKVYTMYELHLEPFLNQEEYYISSELTPENENGDYILLYLSVKKKEEEPLTISYQEAKKADNGQYMASYHIISPAEYEITYNEEGIQFLQSIFDLKAEPVKAYPSQEDILKYGLSEPERIVQTAYMNREGQDYGLQFSVSEMDEKGYVYMMAEGLEVIYRYQAKDAVWYCATLEDIVGKQILVPSITDVLAITLQTANQTCTVQLETTAQGELRIMFDGELCSTKEFKKLYQTIISAEVDSLGGEMEGQQELLVSFEYEYHDGGTDKVSFMEGSGRQAYVLLNGQVYGMIRKSYVNTILESLAQFIGN